MKLELHWKIIIGLALGLIFGVVAATQGWSIFVSNWISPFGKIFINLLKLIAVPLVLSSLITGVASLSDLKKLSRIGGRTISIYIATTTVAVTTGLLAVNIIQPGATVPDEMKKKLQETYPLFAICMGPPIFALANGADTEKMKFGHRGANHPVIDFEKDRRIGNYSTRSCRPASLERSCG